VLFSLKLRGNWGWQENFQVWADYYWKWIGKVIRYGNTKLRIRNTIFIGWIMEIPYISLGNRRGTYLLTSQPKLKVVYPGLNTKE
jgi:hypothetical protein